jgi:hypothetical protein
LVTECPFLGRDVGYDKPMMGPDALNAETAAKGEPLN